jgi:hypothetical protein
MSWHDESPWRAKRKADIVTATQRLADLERRFRMGDLSPTQAVLEAYHIGIEEGRANPAIQRIGQTHTPEVQS